MPYVVQTFLPIVKRIVSTVVIGCAVLGFTSTAFAQDHTNAETLNETKLSQTSVGLNYNLPGPANFESQAGPQLELPIEAVGSGVFKLDLSNPGCANGAASCLSSDGQTKIDLSDTFNRRSEKGLDLSLTPRASMKFDDEVSSTAVGAVIKIGQDLREGSEFKSNTWYFFAGADAEALTYSPDSVGRITSGQFHLQDRIIVGDAQAGLGYRIGDADLSLSYMRREATSDEHKFKEDAATLSFTWKR